MPQFRISVFLFHTKSSAAFELKDTIADASLFPNRLLTQTDRKPPFPELNI